MLGSLFFFVFKRELLRGFEKKRFRKEKGRGQLRVSRESLLSQPSLSLVSCNMPWLHEVVISLSL